MHVHDVVVSATPSDFFKVYENRYVLCNDTLVVYQLDSRVIDLLSGELNGVVNGINVLHVPIECGLSAYKSACKQLIEYIIFHQQNNIVKHNLFFVNEKAEFNAVAQEACLESQKKITSNSYELFPQPDKACFNTGMTQYNFTVGYKDDFHRSWFGNEAAYEHPIEIDEMPLGVDCINKEPYKSDGWYYELTPISAAAREAALTPAQIEQWKRTAMQYQRVRVHETYTISLRKFFSQNMGTFASSVEEDTGSIVIEHYVRFDEYGKIID
jgi:hypothetical protein